MNHPKVTVIIPVFNGGAYIDEAVKSILCQTFTDFELLIIDDGSTDNSHEIIGSIADKRIRVLRNETNTGLAHVRNKGISESKGEYIAWLDCDDISLPERLEQQVHLLDSHPEIGLCGTWTRITGRQEKAELRFPADPGLLRCSMIFYGPMATSSVMMRRACVENQQLLFDPYFPPTEDYDLWERFSRHYKITNIPQILSIHRVHAKQTSAAMADHQRTAIWKIQERLLHLLNVMPSNEERKLHLEIGVDWIFRGTPDAVNSTERWLEKLAEANKKTRLFPEPLFSEVLAERWKFSCFMATRQGIFAWKSFHSSRLSHYVKLSFTTYAHFFLSSILGLPWRSWKPGKFFIIPLSANC